MGYIYKISNDINNKLYIGKTLSSVEQRFKEHLRDARKRTNEHRPLYVAIRKYGEKHFSIELVEECDDIQLSEREIYWIKKFDSFKFGYNATQGGDGSTIYNHDEILGELILNPYADDVARCIGCSVDIVYEVAHRYGIRLRNFSQENKNSNMNECKQVVCISEDVEIFFDSVSNAAKWLLETGKIRRLSSGVRTHISESARGKRLSAYGYRWRYT